MKPYVHNPALFRKHFSGQGLPGFKGARIQRGGSLAGMAASALSRYAVPLLMAGATAAAPRIGKAVGKLAEGAAGRVLPNNPAMQRMVGQVASRAATRVTNKTAKAVSSRVRKSKRRNSSKVQKGRKTKTSRRQSLKRRAARALKNIFS